MIAKIRQQIRRLQNFVTRLEALEYLVMAINFASFLAIYTRPAAPTPTFIWERLGVSPLVYACFFLAMIPFQLKRPWGAKWTTRVAFIPFAFFAGAQALHLLTTSALTYMPVIAALGCTFAIWIVTNDA